MLHYLENKCCGAEAEEGDKDSDGAATLCGSKTKPRPLASRDERLRTEQRINELSQLESPRLRALAQRLGADYNIQTTHCVKKFDKHPYAEQYVGKRWEEYQGCNDWKGLLEPDFDPVLKAEVLRYGEFAQATYDAFDNKKGHLDHYGTCKYLKTDLFKRAGLPNRGYEITDFIYTTTNFRFGHLFHREKLRVNDRESQKSGVNSEKVTEDVDRCEHDIDENNENSQKNRYHGHVNLCKHCTENCKECNWMGFVAVCTSPEEIARLGRRDIVVAWRGSETTIDWITDITIASETFGSPRSEFGSPGVRVHSGFKHIYESRNIHSRYCQEKSAQDQVREAVQALVKKYDQGDRRLSITVTGHSLGSALATLCAYDIAMFLSGASRDPNGLSQSAHNVRHHEDRVNISAGSQVGRPLITLYSFGGPRVGNEGFGDSMVQLGVKVLRVVNKYDLVTKTPGFMNFHIQKKLNMHSNILPSYQHVGVKLKVFTHKSEVLKKITPIDKVFCSRSHSLETYLHLVDSYQGIKEAYQKKEKTSLERLHLTRFSHEIKEDKYKPYKKTFRDSALVNKHQDFLRDECNIPACWWQPESHKGLVVDENGSFHLPERDHSVPRTQER